MPISLLADLAIASMLLIKRKTTATKTTFRVHRWTFPSQLIGAVLMTPLFKR